MKKLLNKISAFLLPIFGGLLGALGGSVNKSFRRVLLPLMIFGFAYSVTESFWVLSILSLMGVLSIGYGIPDATDEGSFLGRFYYKLFNHNHFLADIFTRGTIGLLIGLSLVSLPIIKHAWLIYSICLVGIVLTQSLVSWRNLGTYKLFNKELSWVESITWGLITLFATLIIKL